MRAKKILSELEQKAADLTNQTNDILDKFIDACADCDEKRQNKLKEEWDKVIFDLKVTNRRIILLKERIKLGQQ